MQQLRMAAQRARAAARTGRDSLGAAIDPSARVSTAPFASAGVARAVEPRLVQLEVELARLPAALDGFAIVQITDLHIGNTIGRRFVESVVAMAQAAAGDLIAITGDLVDGSVRRLGGLAAPLADLRARHGVYFVTGNHAYYAGADAWLAHLPALGIQPLRNERASIGDAGASFDLAGVDDFTGRWYRSHGPDLDAALRGRDPARELVLLAHQPRQVHAAARHGVGLQLSGHTHGGQIWPWHYLAAAQQGGLLAGHSFHGATQLYISRGTGYWGPPVRFGAPAEVTRIALRRPRQPASR
jgi:hypothetical protein